MPRLILSLALSLAAESQTEAFGMGALAGLLIGVPIGTVVGSAVKYERWEPLALSGSGQTALSIKPVVGRRFGFSASLALGG